jgi:hypothetical protein
MFIKALLDITVMNCGTYQQARCNQTRIYEETKRVEAQQDSHSTSQPEALQQKPQMNMHHE